MEETLPQRIDALYSPFVKGEKWVAWDKIGFMNIGYWNGFVDTIEGAQLNLIETLTRFCNKSSNILDVACGKGASSKFLTKYFPAKSIIGINISAEQLEICRLIAPECQFRLMDAIRLEFNDASFGNVLCIEAALHFTSRRKFFEEAWRVLEPGGRLAMLDFLCDYDLMVDAVAPVQPKDNYLPNIAAYRQALLDVGFRHVRVEDCTEFTIKPATTYIIGMMERRLAESGDAEIFKDIQQWTRHASSLFAGGLIYAIK